MTLNYRADVDGLRAVAVMSVLLYHVHLFGVTGGYVGVDVFFVISGYLISLILIRECQESRFSIVNFYERRIRRIFPALFLTLAVTSLLAVVVLLPSELSEYGQTLAATCFFISNIAFWQQSNYFDGSAYEKPLLHTWSLSVEEQFYLIWPLMLWVVLRFIKARHLPYLFAALILISLALAEWLSFKSPKTAFYMLPSRAWELALGAVLAVRAAPSIRVAWARELASFSGAALIVLTIVTYEPETRFPGLSAIPPCLGAALIIWAGESGQTLVSRLLETRPFVSVGLISYSLYLWHWPILSLYELNLGHAPSVLERVLLLCAAVLAAFLSWRYVERPFRRSPRSSGAAVAGRRILWAGVTATVAFATLGITAWLSGGFPWRLPDKAVWADHQAARAAIKMPGCALFDAPSPDDLGACIFPGGQSSSVHAVLWGDSHASHYAADLSSVGVAGGLEFRRATKSGCAPLIGSVALDSVGDAQPDCAIFNNKVIDFIARTPQIKVVVMSGRWALLAGERKGDGPLNYLIDGNNTALDAATSQRVFRTSLAYTLDTLRKYGVETVIVGPNPEFPYSVPRCLARAYWHGGTPQTCDRPFGAVVEVVGWADGAIDAIATSRPGIHYLDALSPLCDSTDCKAGNGSNEVFYFDGHHLRGEAARRILNTLDIKALARVPTRISP